MKDLLLRFTSRKFLLTLAGLGVLAYYGQWTEFVAALSAFLAAEGGADLVERFQSKKVELAEAEQVKTAMEQGFTPPGFKHTLVPGEPVSSEQRFIPGQ